MTVRSAVPFPVIQLVGSVPVTEVVIAEGPPIVIGMVSTQPVLAPDCA